jgi:hypothetical protein
MKSMKNILYWGILCTILFATVPACKKKTYPCPGLGQMNEADISQFDESGQLKNSKGKKKKSAPNRRINKDTGLVNKKSPNQIRAPRKTRL